MTAGLFEPAQRKTERFTLRISPDVLAQFEALARKHKLPVSELMRRSMLAAVRADSKARG